MNQDQDTTGATTMTEPTRDDRPAAAFAGLKLDLQPLTRQPAQAAPPPPAAIPAMADTGGAGTGPVAASELLSLTESLTTALQDETNALRRMDMPRFQELSERKVGLANHYATLMWQMRKSPDALQRLPAPERESLRTATEAMRHASHDNETAVRGAHEASQILMNAIAKAAQSRRPNAGTYGANGRAGTSATAASGQASAIFQDTLL